MLQTEQSSLSRLVIHWVGNKAKEEDLRLSQRESGLDATTLKIVWEYLRSAFKQPDFYRFSHPTDLALNNVYATAQQVFAQPDNLLEYSGALAKLLYAVSDHPQVKSGELMVIYFDKLCFGALSCPALALFKSEHKQPFLFTEEDGDSLELYSYSGITPGRVDKAALIFDSADEEGYQVLCVDNVNRGEETKFWFEQFLQIKLRSTEYARTEKLISATKSFIEQDLGGEEALDRREALELIGRSKDFFSESESYRPAEYSEQVFGDPVIADRFQTYVKERDLQELGLDQEFEISAEAVKKQQKVFKSILKLDKNFHVYIHGDRSKIEKGSEADGRKFYKIYYEEER